MNERIAAHRSRLAPVRQAVYDPELRTTVLRGVGFRAFCECGWRGHVKPTLRDAGGEAAEHRLDQQQPPASPE